MAPADPPGAGRAAAPAKTPPLPPKPDFTPADIPGNLAEARVLRTIGMGQPIKASWLCRETLEIYRRHALPPDLDLVDALRVLTLAYTDAIKRGSVTYAASAEDTLVELASLGGIPDAAAIHRRSKADPAWDPGPRLAAFEIDASSTGAEGGMFESPFLRFRLARLPAGARPEGPGGLVDVSRVAGSEILVPGPVRLQARYECLYLRGLVGMSQALRIERAGQAQASAGRLAQELAYLIDAAWWFHLAGLVAREAPASPDECHRRARAKSSMLIRRIETGKHFEMPSLDLVDMLE